MKIMVRGFGTVAMLLLIGLLYGLGVQLSQSPAQAAQAPAGAYSRAWQDAQPVCPPPLRLEPNEPPLTEYDL